MTRVRMKPADRSAQLLNAAYELAKVGGVKAVTRIGVAEATDTTDGLINRYFTGRKGLRDAVIAEAIKRKDVAVLAWAEGQEGFALPDMPRQLRRDVNAQKIVDAER